MTPRSAIPIAPTYSISGTVRDAKHSPLARVRISDGAGHDTMTGVDGRFVLGTVPRGITTLVPSKRGYTFSPGLRTVSGPPDATAEFIGVPGGDPPMSFLQLPFRYDGTVPGFWRALLDTDELGRVESWFDHEYPDYGRNGNIVLYDGRERTKDPYTPELGCFERRCYDGHNGEDYVYQRLPGEDPAHLQPPIYAAAGGTVVEVNTGCAVGNLSCGHAYGNYLVVDHHNGYYTMYGHLARPLVGVGTEVQAGQVIGIMGTTGNSGGAHVHFSVFRDTGSGHWEGLNVDKPVDPYGWLGQEADPWVRDRQGPASYWLWSQAAIKPFSFSGSQGAQIASAVGNVQMAIPPGAFSGQVTLQLALAPVPPSPGIEISTGDYFWLQALQWQPEDSNPADPNSLGRPITLTVHYDEQAIRHLNPVRLVLHRWDPQQNTWQALVTTVDLDKHTATAQTHALGQFDLDAPLRCTTDDYEPDDYYYAGPTIQADGIPRRRSFDLPEDEDWFHVKLQAGERYIFETTQLAPGVDTVIELYDRGGLNMLTADDKSSGEKASQLTWVAPASGLYYFRIRQGPGSATGCGATYYFTATHITPEGTPIPPPSPTP